MPNLTLNEAKLQQWIGRERTQRDHIDTRQAEHLRVSIAPDRAPLGTGDVLPAGWHWIYFLEAPRIDALGADGHAALGDFLPPVDLPTRMWAGTRLSFHAPLRLGTQLRRRSQIVSVERKQGRSGPLCFVTVAHSIFDGDALLLEEEHDIVYRSPVSQPAPLRTTGAPVRDVKAAVESAAASAGDSARAGNASDATTHFDRELTIVPTSTLLFRYSALTFNGHRIHYDLDFCRKVEGYRGLVVHAPLTATLMLAMAEAHGAEQALSIRAFRFRALAPLFHGEPLRLGLHADTGAVEAIAADGRLAATAELELS